MKRFDFDYTTLSRFKLNNAVTFPEILNVKKYLVEEEPTKPDINDDEVPDLVSDTEEQEADEAALYKYELFSIMIHSGSATGGHYYAYIKCFEQNQWYDFNDERVSKLDKHEITKAFGTTYSMYSSATAYMLLYRQINKKRNEKFMKIDEFSEHIRHSLDKERRQQVEADLLKEYMENVCKIKVIVPDFSNQIETEEEKTKNMLQSGLRREKTINIHKDLTLDKAKSTIIKVNLFNMSNCQFWYLFLIFF